MNKITKKVLTKKWAVLLVISLFLVVFGRLVDNKALTQTGIVVGLGVDFSDGEYETSAQIVVLTGGAESAQSTENYITYRARGKTIGEAIDEISKKAGLIVSLSHCNLVIMSKSALSLDPVEVFLPLIGTYAMPEQAIVVTTEEEDIGKVLSAKVSSAVTLPFFVQESLLQDLGTGGYAVLATKEYIAKRLSRSASAMLPIIELEELDDKPVSNASSSGGDEKSYVVSLSRNLVVSPYSTFPLDKDLSEIAGLYVTDYVKDKLRIESDGGQFEFDLIKKTVKTEIDGYTVKVKTKLVLAFVEAQGVNTDEKLTCNHPAVKKAGNELARRMENSLRECFRISRETGADFLGLENEVYRKIGRTLPENCLDLISFEASYSAKVREN